MFHLAWIIGRLVDSRPTGCGIGGEDPRRSDRSGTYTGRVRATGSARRTRVWTLWRRWWSLESEDRLLLFQACALLPGVELSLRCLGVSPTLSWVAATAGRRSASTTPAHTLPRARLSVARASRYGLTAGRCLSRSVVLWWLLQRRGISTRLRLGVGRREPTFDAHAWLEDDRGVLNDTPDVVVRYPASFVVLQ